MKIVIVGGMAGGAAAAARVRRLDEDAEIIVFERGRDISYASCGIPYHLGDVIKDRDAMVVIGPEKFKSLLDVDVRVRHEVISIDRDRRQVRVVDRNSGAETNEPYDCLVLSPGGRAVRPPISGIDDSRVFTLRDLEDMDEIEADIRSRGVRRAVVIGAGFIGLEVAENLHHLGLQTSLVEAAPQVLERQVDPETAAQIHDHIRDKGVDLYLGDPVKEFLPEAEQLTVATESGRALPADLVLVCIGIRPETRLAVDAGLETGSCGGILVDDHMRTSDPYIYAVGDAVEMPGFSSGVFAITALAGPAGKQARVAADNICGGDSTYSGSLGTAIVKVFDMTVASVGENERCLRSRQAPFVRSYTHDVSHASYYPGALPLTIKLLFEPDSGRLLGAQVTGYDGVDKRIEMLSACMHFKGTVHDLASLEQAYAPPYSSGRDPVNTAGMVAENILAERFRVVYWDDVDGLKERGAVFLDVRTAPEQQVRPSPDADLQIPLEELRGSLAKLPVDKPLVVLCQRGLRAYFAYRILTQRGFKDVSVLSGGIKARDAGLMTQANDWSCPGNCAPGDVVVPACDEGQAPAGARYEAPASAKEVPMSVLEVNACGLQCPGPIMKLAEVMSSVPVGGRVEITASDPGFKRDVASWCKGTGHTLVSLDADGPVITAVIEKNAPGNIPANEGALEHDKTIIVFSGDLDRAIAAFIIANGAASMGRKVTLFFTFWGLNVIRRSKAPKVRKDILARAFGAMMPRGSERLGLSRLNMAGMGGRMIRFVMRRKNVDSLESLIDMARKQGVRLVACQMSLDVMGLTQDELLEGVEIGGVASMLEASERSDATLFI